MHLQAQPHGDTYTTGLGSSDVLELSLAPSGLRIVVYTNHPTDLKSRLVEFLFERQRGFRALDEGDLLRYWESGTLTHGHHLYEITAGGWVEQELQVDGMLSVTCSDGPCREWFVATDNLCVNILSSQPPLVRVLHYGA